MLNKDALQKIRIQALKDKNKVLKSVSALLMGEIDFEEKGNDKSLSERDIVETVVKTIKNAKASLKVFEKRKDESNIALTKEEIKSLEYILTFDSEYKPPLKEDEIIEIIKSNGQSLEDMSKVMNHLKANYLGRYDAGETASLVMKTLKND